ncbi:hypothetical protein BBOV_II000410 [Babesia bovis T2Bo]|uniref:Uncharacterized protein n=1 Tax=Babesia bovis TaxID=5865 RepID=A7ASU0_BABBO|nr:hypothetical protein BBOV_II000410 [Babesia bovis T2Bo]EDO06001.1 hypothetical protein BBOV_II000410 [Babesia bovis T2Bo]|eukprot:XP_001609569.1 hypothetical protein [Babesia bovis T2Bo]
MFGPMHFKLALFIVALCRFRIILSEDVVSLSSEDIFPTAEKRFRAVMRMINGDGFNEKLVKLALDKVTTQCKAIMGNSSESNALTAGEGVHDQAAAASNHHAVNDQLATSKNANSCKEYNDLFVENLTNIGKRLNSIFQSMFADDYKVKIIGKDLEFNEGQLGSMFLDLRFVFPPLSDDLKSIYTLINPEKKSSYEKTGIKDKEKEMVKEWVSNNAPGMISAFNMNEEQLWTVMYQLFNTDVSMLESLKLRIDVFNNNAGDLKQAKELCKKQNSAMFGSIALLISAVLMFTIS